MSPEQSERLKRAAKIALIPVMGGLIVKSTRREGGIIGYAYNFKDSGTGRFMFGFLQEGLKEGRDRIRVAGRFLPGRFGEVSPDDFDVELDDREFPDDAVEELTKVFPDNNPEAPPLQEA